MNPFQSFHDYEEFIYTLADQFPTILTSTLVVIRRGAAYAIVKGELHFQHGYRLEIQEHVTAEYSELQIERYSYEVWRADEKLYWYDSQPHPNDPQLASTHPHHKHTPPDIKHNRIPAPGISFDQPNLPFLLQEIKLLMENSRTTLPYTAIGEQNE